MAPKSNKSRKGITRITVRGLPSSLDSFFLFAISGLNNGMSLAVLISVYANGGLLTK